MNNGHVQNTGLTIRARLPALLAASLLLTADLFLFTPAAIVQGNRNEFAAGLFGLLRQFALPAGLLLALLVAAGLLWPRHGASRFISLVGAVGLLLWIQGSFLVWRYGLLDGQAFDWSAGRWRGVVDSLLWLGVLTVAVVFHRRLFRFVARTSIMVLAIQLAFLTLTLNRKTLSPRQAPHLPQPALTQFAASGNVVHVLLDGFQSTLFQKLLVQNRSRYNQALAGFTFFREAIGVFPTTYMSIPAIFSGRTYRNEVPLKEFLHDTLRGQTIQNVLLRNGYEVDLIHAVPSYIDGLYTNAYFIPQPYSKNSRYRDRAQAAMLFDLTLFRVAPHFAKRLIYNDQAWLFQRFYTRMDMYPAMGHRRFFADFIAAATVARTNPVYKFIHLVTTHAPVIFDRQGHFTGKPLPWNENNQLNQARLGFEQFIEFLDQLRRLHLYDSALIILQADTGSGHPVELKNSDLPAVDRKFRSMVGGALPLLLIKPPHAQGPLAVSDAPVMLTDIPATIDALLGLKADFPGRSAFAPDLPPDRPRAYSSYAWVNQNWLQDYLPPMETYEIRGSAFDARSWHHTGSIPSGGNAQEPAEPVNTAAARTIQFGCEKTERENLLQGWSGNEVTANRRYRFNWALGRAAALRIRLPRDRETVLTARIIPYTFEQALSITVKVDGRTVGVWKPENIWQMQTFHVRIPADAARPDPSTVEFQFSQFRRPAPRERDQRPLAVLFESITIAAL